MSRNFWYLSLSSVFRHLWKISSTGLKIIIYFQFRNRTTCYWVMARNVLWPRFSHILCAGFGGSKFDWLQLSRKSTKSSSSNSKRHLFFKIYRFCMSLKPNLQLVTVKKWRVHHLQTFLDASLSDRVVSRGPADTSHEIGPFWRYKTWSISAWVTAINSFIHWNMHMNRAKIWVFLATRPQRVHQYRNSWHI